MMSRTLIRTLVTSGTALPVLLGAYIRQPVVQTQQSLVVGLCIFLLCHTDDWFPSLEGAEWQNVQV